MTLMEAPPRDALVSLAAVEIMPGLNDRTTFEPVALAELAASIEAHGLAQPPTVRPVAGGYEIVAGERRFRAMRDVLGWSEIPCMIREMSDETASSIMLAENVQRADLDPIEEARAYQNRIARFGYSLAQIADVAAVPIERVRKRLSLLALAPEIAHMVSRKQLPLAYAYCLSPLDSNRQLLALRAYPVSLETFRALANRLLMEQEQGAMFDPDSFLQVEEYVAEAVQTVEETTTLIVMTVDPVGLKEIAERLGVKPQTAWVWRHRDILPQPRWIISGQPAWNWPDIEKWYDGRSGRGIPKKADS